MDYNDTYAGEFSYHNITRSQISIDKYNGQSNRVEIPEKISGQEVIEIGEGAFSDNLILEHVQLPDSVTAIKDNAYYGCRNLKIVHFGIGIKSIGDNAFAECESLQTIQIRSKLDYLGKNAFTLSGIETVEIAFIQNWQEESFALCSRLVSVSVKKAVKTQKEADQIQTNLVAVEDAHSRRPRAAYFGELQQMDATPYEWIPGQIWHLHLAIDDSTGRITGGWFDTQETLNGYYHVFHQILTTYGIPYKFFTDRRTVFTYKKKNSPSIDEDTYTQFAYACKQLGVELEASSVPQAKGRVERLNQTLQSRLPIELRLAGVTTIDAANEFLNSYIKEFNEKFSLPLNGIKSVFEEQPENEKINLILAVLCERTVDTGHCLRHSNKYYRMPDSKGLQVHYRKGTKVMFIQAFNGNKYCSVNDKDVYALEEIPEHEAKSKDIDIDYTPPKPKKTYIPPMNHPWRRQQFGKFVKQQEHHWQDDKIIPA